MPNHSAKPLLAALLACSMLGNAQSQVFPEGNGIAFANVSQFDLYVEVNRWHGMAGDATSFRLDTQRLLEASLREIGASRRPASRHHLVCRLQARLDGEQVSYSSTLEYWGMQSTDVHSLLWRQGDVHVSTAIGFTPGLIADQCAGYFQAEWSKWNSVSEKGW